MRVTIDIQGEDLFKLLEWAQNTDGEAWSHVFTLKIDSTDRLIDVSTQRKTPCMNVINSEVGAEKVFHIERIRVRR